MPVKPAPAKGWPKGMNNILADYEIPGDALRRAVNVDVLNSGKVRRRKGITQLASARSHSLYDAGPYALLYYDGDLCRMSAPTPVVLRDSIVNRPIAYTKAGDTVFWSNGRDYGKIVNGVDMPWGVEQPRQPPSLASATGTMTGGTYQAVVTFVTADGEESAPSRAAAIAISDNGALSVSSIPQPVSAAVDAVRLYVTPPNGEVFYRQTDLAVGVTTHDIAVSPAQGQVLRTQFLSRFPPCNLLTHYRGRIYGALGNILWYTEPFFYGVYKPSSNFMVYPEEITMIRAVTGGIYVASDKTYWLGGTGPDDMVQTEILPYGAARRSDSKLPGSDDVMWMGHRGLVVGSQNGQAKAVQEASVTTDAYEDATTIMREQNGIRQLMGVGRNPLNISALAAQDFMDIEVVRHAEN